MESILRTITVAFLIVCAALVRADTISGDTVTGLVAVVSTEWSAGTKVTFTPLTTPAGVKGAFIRSQPKVAVVGTNGVVSQLLAGPLYYKVAVDDGIRFPRDVMTIYVIGDGATRDWLSITTNAAIANTNGFGFVTGVAQGSNILTATNMLGVVTVSGLAPSLGDMVSGGSGLEITNRMNVLSVAASNLSYAIGLAVSNLSYALGANDTNYANSMSLNNSNFTASMQSGTFLGSNFLAMGISNIISINGLNQGIGTNGGILYITNVVYQPTNNALTMLAAMPWPPTNQQALHSFHHGPFGVSGASNLFFPLGVITASSAFSASGTMLTNNNVRLMPWYSGSGGVLSNLTARISAGQPSSNVRFGIYESTSSTNLYPGALIFDSGTCSSVPATNITVNTAYAVIKPGRVYWSFITTDTSGVVPTTPTSSTAFENILGYTTPTSATAPIVAIDYPLGSFGSMPATFPTASASTISYNTGTGATYAVILFARFL